MGDGVELWGAAEVLDDLGTKRRLWSGVFDYDLVPFAPGGPDDSPEVAFMAVHPTRALLVRQYGMGGTERWKAAARAARRRHPVSWDPASKGR